MATLTLVLASEAPDVDILGYVRGPVYGFAHHRGITHSFVGAPFVAALVLAFVYLVWRWRRRHQKPRPVIGDHVPVDTGPPQPPRWGVLYGFAVLGVLVHILLDFTNAYGVRPFEPFSYSWYSWDIVSIIEPLLCVALLAGLVLPELFGLVTEEIGARRRGPRGRTGAILALIGVALVWGVRDYEHRRAVAAMESLLYRGAEPLRVGAYPYMINPFRWFGVVETETFYARMEVDSSVPEVDPRARTDIRFKPEETPASLAAKSSYLGRVYLDWARFPMTEVQELSRPEGWYLVRFFDMRYAYPERRTRPLSASVELNRDLAVVRENFGLGVQGRREMGDDEK